MKDLPCTITYKTPLVSAVLDNNQFYLPSSSQIFQKWQEATNIIENYT